MNEWIKIEGADGSALPAYLARPEGSPRGTVVVLQEIFGVNRHIRAVADAYAAAGYLACAPSMFERIEPGVELGYTGADVSKGAALKQAVESLPAPGVMPDLQAIVDTVSKSGRVALVGFCWGGLLAWRASEQLSGLSAVVSYYGGGMTTPAEMGRTPRVPVLAHFGERDQHIPLDTVRAFQAAQPQVEVHTYEADHGFNCDERGAWNAQAAAVARQRTLAFLAKHIG